MKSSGRDTEGLPQLNLVVVYEDTTTRDRALQVCDHLAIELEDEVHFNSTWWRVDFLTNPHIAWQATQAALRADMILFSLHAGPTLPPALEHWAQSWVEDREISAGAVVGLIGSRQEFASWASPRHARLAKLAESARMEYLPQGCFNPDEISAAAMSQVGERAHSLTPVLKEILSHPHPSSHWGLNE